MLFSLFGYFPLFNVDSLIHYLLLSTFEETEIPLLHFPQVHTPEFPAMN